MAWDSSSTMVASPARAPLSQCPIGGALLLQCLEAFQTALEALLAVSLSRESSSTSKRLDARHRGLDSSTLGAVAGPELDIFVREEQLSSS
jgi:hypothetical protein